MNRASPSSRWWRRAATCCRRPAPTVIAAASTVTVNASGDEETAPIVPWRGLGVVGNGPRRRRRCRSAAPLTFTAISVLRRDTANQRERRSDGTFRSDRADWQLAPSRLTTKSPARRARPRARSRTTATCHRRRPSRRRSATCAASSAGPTLTTVAVGALVTPQRAPDADQRSR